MAGKVNVFEDYSGLYYVAWIVDDDEGGPIGGMVSQSISHLEKLLEKAKKERKFEDYETFFVELDALKWWKINKEVGASLHNGGIYLESKKLAGDLMRTCRASIAAAKIAYDSDVEWPEWAKQAVAAGWKAPKGWKP